MGANNQHNDYYESLFRRTTASYRAKCDRESGKMPALDTEPSCSRRAAAENRRVIRERNNKETSTSSYDILSSASSSKSPDEKKVGPKTDKRSLKSITEKMLAQVLSDKYSQEFVEKDHKHSSEEKSPIESVIEQLLKEKLTKLRHPLRQKQSTSFSDPGSLRTLIEDIVNQVLTERFANFQNQNEKSNIDEVKHLKQDLEQKLTISYNQDDVLPREPFTHYNNNRPLDTQFLVQELLRSEKAPNKKFTDKDLTQSKAGKENSKTPSKVCGIKRLQRSPSKKPEWQDPSLHDNILDKPVKAIRAQSPTVSSSVRSGRSSSVLIRRAKSIKRRKPISDPVALYQYYKTEWEHFRNQIPGETSHGRLRWHVRQRLLDPE